MSLSPLTFLRPRQVGVRAWQFGQRNDSAVTLPSASGRMDLNHRPPASEAGRLTKLTYVPFAGGGVNPAHAWTWSDSNRRARARSACGFPAETMPFRPFEGLSTPGADRPESPARHPPRVCSRDARARTARLQVPNLAGRHLPFIPFAECHAATPPGQGYRSSRDVER